MSRACSMRAPAAPWRGAAWWRNCCRGRPADRGPSPALFCFLSLSLRSVRASTGVGAGAEEHEARRLSRVRGEADDGVVAMAPRELEEHRALVLGRVGNSTAITSSPGCEVDLEQALEELLRPRPGARRPCRDTTMRRIERHRAGGVLGRGIGEREAAADGAAVADRRDARRAAPPRRAAGHAPRFPRIFQSAHA